jgi:hypothetical protein
MATRGRYVRKTSLLSLVSGVRYKGGERSIRKKAQATTCLHKLLGRIQAVFETQVLLQPAIRSRFKDEGILEENTVRLILEICSAVAVLEAGDSQT